jgi:hypothetical protein
VRVGEAVSRLSLEIGGFETPLAFAVGAPDRICLMNRLLMLRPRVTQLPVFVAEGAALARAGRWLSGRHHVEAMNRLNCSKHEPLYVYKNALVLLAVPERTSAGLLESLVHFADSLPRPPSTARPEGHLTIDGLTLGPELLPEDLRKLLPHVERWAVGDDIERHERLVHAKRGELAKLLREVGPMLIRIDEYLDSFGSGQLPDEAVLLGELAQAVAELRAVQAEPVSWPSCQ